MQILSCYGFHKLGKTNEDTGVYQSAFLRKHFYKNVHGKISGQQTCYARMIITARTNIGYNHVAIQTFCLLQYRQTQKQSNSGDQWDMLLLQT